MTRVLGALGSKETIVRRSLQYWKVGCDRTGLTLPFLCRVANLEPSELVHILTEKGEGGEDWKFGFDYKPYVSPNLGYCSDIKEPIVTLTTTSPGEVERNNRDNIGMGYKDKLIYVDNLLLYLPWLGQIVCGRFPGLLNTGETSDSDKVIQAIIKHAEELLARGLHSVRLEVEDGKQILLRAPMLDNEVDTWLSAVEKWANENACRERVGQAS